MPAADSVRSNDLGGHSGTLAQANALPSEVLPDLRMVIPETVKVLLPLADLWGVGDDYERAAMVDGAPLGELRTMVAAVDAVPDDDLCGWLAGPESHSSHPSPEYVAITCLIMAADHARLRLRRD